MASKVTPSDVAHVANLANLKVNSQEQQQFAVAFSATLDEIDRLQELDTSDVEPTHQVNNLVNIWRADEVDQRAMISKQQALGQAKKTFNSYVVVDRIIEEE